MLSWHGIPIDVYWNHRIFKFELKLPGIENTVVFDYNLHYIIVSTPTVSITNSIVGTSLK